MSGTGSLISRLAFSLLFLCATASRTGAAANMAPATLRNIPYAEPEGGDPRLLTLDLYPAPAPMAPVMIWVHGGAWMAGDKARVFFKPAYFNDQGFLFVSVNYRLSPRVDVRRRDFVADPSRIRYPVHEQDVALAIRWVVQHVEEHGGDPRRVSLIGHSAGGAIASLLGTDDAFLETAGVPLDTLRCVISLDIGGAYDLSQSAPGSVMFQNAYGTLEESDDGGLWRKASPVYQVGNHAISPAFFLVTSRGGRGQELSEVFADTLTKADRFAELLVVDMGHASIGRGIGDPADQSITPRLTRFLDECR